MYNATNTDTAFGNFSETFQKVFDQVCPVKETKVKNKELINPWMSPNLIKCSKRKQVLYNKFLKTRSPTDEVKYKNYKNLFQKLIKKAKITYYSNQLDIYKNNSKKTWEIINKITGRSKAKKESLPKNININNKYISEKNEMCKKLNEYFVNVGPELASKINNSNFSFDHYLGNPCPSEIENNDLSFKEFDSALSYLKPNKASGYDDINSNIILHVIDSIRRPLFHTLKLSLKDGVFPQLMKIAKVIPIFKKGDASLLKNYRPISLLPIFSKIYERVVYNRLYKH